MTDHYSGPAQIRGLATGDQDVHAELHRVTTPDGASWSGTVTGHWSQLTNESNHAELHMPDDRCGDVILGTHDADNLASVQGLGPCPFD